MINIWYILYLCFLKKSIQWKCLNKLFGKSFATAVIQITHTHIYKHTHTHTHTHTHLESLHIFLQSNYKLVTWIKRFVKVYSSSFICVSSGIWIPIKCNMTVNSISINHQNSIAKTPFTHCISLRRYVFFFFCMLN